MQREQVLVDATVDRLIPMVQRSAARAALLRDRRVEIQLLDDGRVVAHIIDPAR